MKQTIAVMVALAVLVGCSSFSTNTFRTEQTLTQLAYGAYVVYTNGLHDGTIHVTPDQSNAVRTARLQFAASVGVLDTWRVAYETNSAVKPQVEAALTAAALNSSNFVFVAKLFTTP